MEGLNDPIYEKFKRYEKRGEKTVAIFDGLGSEGEFAMDKSTCMARMDSLPSPEIELALKNWRE